MCLSACVNILDASLLLLSSCPVSLRLVGFYAHHSFSVTLFPLGSLSFFYYLFVHLKIHICRGNPERVLQLVARQTSIFST